MSTLVTVAEAQALLDASMAANELQCAAGRPCRACDARIDAVRALTDAAPTLVATIVAQAAEVERLRRALLPDVVDSLCVDSLRARAEAAERERDALRDAAREYLAARDGWEFSRVLRSTTARVTLDAARTRLAALVGGVAVVACPACGVDITADLDDDGVYVTRRHSRREPARVGLGEIAWCDGGVVRP